MYFRIGIKPEIAFALRKLSLYCENACIVHWAAVKQIFRYINGTKIYVLIYSKLKNVLLLGYSGAD